LVLIYGRFAATLLLLFGDANVEGGIIVIGLAPRQARFEEDAAERGTSPDKERLPVLWGEWVSADRWGLGAIPDVFLAANEGPSPGSGLMETEMRGDEILDSSGGPSREGICG
jgi:hypothetical protein